MSELTYEVRRIRFMNWEYTIFHDASPLPSVPVVVSGFWTKRGCTRKAEYHCRPYSYQL